MQGPVPFIDVQPVLSNKQKHPIAIITNVDFILFSLHESDSVSSWGESGKTKLALCILLKHTLLL